MKRLFAVMFIGLCLVGCEPEERVKHREAVEAKRVAEAKARREEQEAELKAKIDLLKTNKILNIRMNDSTMDFILSDGAIITVYSYVTGNGSAVHHHLGVK